MRVFRTGPVLARTENSRNNAAPWRPAGPAVRFEEGFKHAQQSGTAAPRRSLFLSLLVSDSVRSCLPARLPASSQASHPFPLPALVRKRVRQESGTGMVSNRYLKRLKSTPKDGNPF